MTENDHKQELIDILQNASLHFINGRNPSLDTLCIRINEEDRLRLLDALGVVADKEEKSWLP